MSSIFIQCVENFFRNNLFLVVDCLKIFKKSKALGMSDLTLLHFACDVPKRGCICDALTGKGLLYHVRLALTVNLVLCLIILPC